MANRDAQTNNSSIPREGRVRIQTSSPQLHHSSILGPCTLSRAQCIHHLQSQRRAPTLSSQPAPYHVISHILQQQSLFSTRALSALADRDGPTNNSSIPREGRVRIQTTSPQLHHSSRLRPCTLSRAHCTDRLHSQRRAPTLLTATMVFPLLNSQKLSAVLSVLFSKWVETPVMQPSKSCASGGGRGGKTKD